MTFHLDHQSLLVADLERSVAFYRDVLGLHIVRSSGTPVSGIWMGQQDGKDLFHLNVGAPTLLPKDNHIALRTTGFDALVERFASEGVKFVDWPGKAGTVGRHPLGFRQIYIQDPDGYWVEINDVAILHSVTVD